MKIFIIPGNPPATYFYEEWKREILAQAPTVEVRVSAYPDILFRQKSTDYIRQVAEYHQRELETFVGEARAPALVVGHSIGAFFALTLLEQVPTLIHKCFLVHPFLRPPTFKGQAILRLLSFARQWDAFENLVLRYRDQLARLDGDLRYVSDQELRVCLKLAFHEHHVVARNRQPLEIEEPLRSKLQLVYTSKDTWCTRSTVRALREQIAIEESRSSHDFVRSPEQRQDVFSVIQKHL